MFAIGPFLERILQSVLSILGLANLIYGNTVKTAQETSPFFIQDKVNAVQGTVDNVGYGNFAIKTDTAAILTNLAADVATILAAIGTPQQAGSPVVLPTTPPTGYGNVTAAAIASAVWTYIDPVFSQPTIDLLIDGAASAIQNADFDASAQTHGYAGWVLQVQPANGGNANPGPDLFPLDFSSVLATDATAVDWMNRIYGAGYFSDFGGGAPYLNDSNGFTYAVPWLIEPTFQILRDQALGLGNTIVAPVWPGLASVTLGTPVSISLTFTVAGPLHGVLVALATVPGLKGQYDYDGLSQSLKIGALTFVSDNGDAEYVQALGFTTEVYVPKNMASAASCIVRTVSGVTGTVTPFTIP